MAKTPLMPVSASMVLSVSNSINASTTTKREFIEFCEKNEIVLYIAQADIDLLKPMLLDPSRVTLGTGAAETLSRDRCKDTGG